MSIRETKLALMDLAESDPHQALELVAGLDPQLREGFLIVGENGLLSLVYDKTPRILPWNRTAAELVPNTKRVFIDATRQSKDILLEDLEPMAASVEELHISVYSRSVVLDLENLSLFSSLKRLRVYCDGTEMPLELLLKVVPPSLERLHYGPWDRDSSTRVEDLSGIARLEQLQFLFVGCRVENTHLLGKLPNLRAIDLKLPITDPNLARIQVPYWHWPQP